MKADKKSKKLGGKQGRVGAKEAGEHNIAEIKRWQREALLEPIPDFCEFVPDPANLHSDAESNRARHNHIARGVNPSDLNLMSLL